MVKRFHLYLIIVFFAPFFGCSKSDTSPNAVIVSIKDILPRDNEISGWVRTNRSWLARNADDLQREIDGGFEIYVNHGFVEGAMQGYIGRINDQTDVECEVEITDQHSSTEAQALFDDPQKAFSNPYTPTNPPSPNAQIEKRIFSYEMKFTKGKYYVAISLHNTDDKAEEVIGIFANNIGNKIR
ncbi:MAG: hypothetical protein QHI48_07395 [Bacteroidota bacterium]|nr:hypothetical protein [Bacteroidota bacterium]